jgi:hypothetical protein
MSLRAHVIDGVLNMHATSLHGPGDITGGWPSGANEHRHSYCVLENVGVKVGALGI